MTIQHHIAQIGCGYWGPNLLRNCVTNPRCAIKYVCDLFEKRRHYVKQLYPTISTLSDYKHALNDDSITAVIIATPVQTHFNIAIEALKAGKHILVEKPMAVSTQEIEQIKALSETMGLIAMA